MKRKNTSLLFLGLILLSTLFLSCSKDDNPVEPKSQICFTVSGTNVTIENFWKNGSSYSKDIGGLLSFDQTVNINNETHTLSWQEISTDYQTHTVVSFKVTIDGVEYHYPRDKCGGGVEYLVKFKINGTQKTYKANCLTRNYPCGCYSSAVGSYPEQYNIFGSASVSSCQSQRDLIIIGLLHSESWSVEIQYYDENGNSFSFHIAPIDISILNTANNQFQAVIPGSASNGNGTKTISEISFLAENANCPEPEVPQYLTHNTGNLHVSILENGNIGYLKTKDEDWGEGIVFKSNASAIYASGIIYGTAERGYVDGLIGSFNVNDVLSTETQFSGFTSLPEWDQIAHAKYNDYSAENPYHVEIDQTSYSNTGDNFVIIKYSFSSNNSLAGFYAGIFADWDVGGSGAYNKNKGGYDDERDMAYQFVGDGSADQSYYGIVALSGLSGAKITDQAVGGSARDSSFNWITTYDNEEIKFQNDYRMWIGSGPFNINFGNDAEVYFAFVAGDNLNDLKTSADAAILKYSTQFK